VGGFPPSVKRDGELMKMKANARVRVLLNVLTVGGVALTSLAQEAPPAARGEAIPAIVEFNRDIRPILSDKCYTCHGPSKQMGTLRFDREEIAKHALSAGRFAIFPGDPAKSEVIRRVSSSDPGVRMPRGGEALSAREVELLRRWIEQGAVWQKHWAFISPKRPDIPRVSDPGWVRNGIDSFVLARLDREGLKPSPLTDRVTLLRRVSFDLTGVPPTTPEIDAFVADKSTNAYEKVVDRLLASPRYGERMAFPWLEAARYADTNGYLRDGERHMWRWRDWVINAFNRNMPFDEFTIEQLAGDLLPNATLDQKIATGFNRNHRGNSEGGIIPEEYQAEYVMDRAETTGTVFLGLTVGCARCHDHKYDPTTQRDFYQMFAYFNSIPESGKARQIGNSFPYIKAPLPDQERTLGEYDRSVASATSRFANLQSRLVRSQKDWEASLDKSGQVQWGPSKGLVAYYALDGTLGAPISITADGKAIPLAFQDGPANFVPGQIGQAAGFDGKTFLQGGDITGFESKFGSGGYRDDAYTLAAWVYPTADTGAIVTKVADITQPVGHGLNLKDGKLEYNYVNDWVDDGMRMQTEKKLSLNQWHQVTVAYDGTRYAKGVHVYVDGEEWKWHVLLDDVNNTTSLKREPLRIGGGGGPQNRFHGSIDDVRIYNRALTSSEAGILANTKSVNEIAAIPEQMRNAAQAAKIRDYFLENAAPADIREAWKQQWDAQVKRDEYYETLPTVMVMEEMPTPRESHILIRGAYDRPGEKVQPTMPGFLESAPENYASNRLGLARWLVGPSNPLTARVTVNRFWQMYFGTGIVRTVEDFGLQSESPSHPELLDWLATEFIRTGWDMKALQKTIVMSSTYQQSSKTTPEITQRDPENRLLSHGPRFRLPAAMIRDQALAVSGLLVDQVGGPSVKSYQPNGVWADTSAVYTQDHGDKLYRRSVYSYWKRNIPPPTMSNFDAATRESCVVRQNLTNTPLQALDLMNDTAFLEAARVLAQRVMEEGGETSEDRITYAFRRITGRTPRKPEIRILLDAFNFQLDAFQSKPESAVEYVSQGEFPRDPKLNVSQLAAYTALASTILNLDETSTKE